MLNSGGRDESGVSLVVGARPYFQINEKLDFKKDTQE